VIRNSDRENRSVSRLTDIAERIDCALEICRWRQMAVRRICLNAEDRRALARRLGRRQVAEYRGHTVRPAKASVIYSTFGVPVSVPKALSHRVAP